MRFSWYWERKFSNQTFLSKQGEIGRKKALFDEYPMNTQEFSTKRYLVVSGWWLVVSPPWVQRCPSI